MKIFSALTLAVSMLLVTQTAMAQQTTAQPTAQAPASDLIHCNKASKKVSSLDY
jgi:hypothetical protein